MIILIGGEKGGTGKTTLATNIAAKLTLAGKDVLIVDTDKQGSASAWTATRDENAEVKRIACVQKFGKGIAAEIKDLSSRYKYIIVDAGGRDSVELRSSMVVANRLYIPIQASQFDVWTLGAMDEIVSHAKGFNPSLTANIVINRAPTNPVINEVEEAKMLLHDFENLSLCRSIVRDRIAFRKAAAGGISIFEVNPQDSKAVMEIENLCEEIFISPKTSRQKEEIYA